MLDELVLLLDTIPDPIAPKQAYLAAIRDDNCLGKRSVKSRHLTAKHLMSLYGLDPAIPVFRTLRFFWPRDEAGRPLLALLCAYARDPLLRLSAPFIWHCAEGTTFTREAMEDYIHQQAPDRFSPATLKSVAQNLNGTWTKSGHLTGHVRKTRTPVQVTAGAAAYVLYLGYLQGARGAALFESSFAKLLDDVPSRIMELATGAARRGWIDFKRIGHVMEIRFPDLIPPAEEEWLHE